MNSWWLYDTRLNDEFMVVLWYKVKLWIHGGFMIQGWMMNSWWFYDTRLNYEFMMVLWCKVEWWINDGFMIQGWMIYSHWNFTIAIWLLQYIYDMIKCIRYLNISHGNAQLGPSCADASPQIPHYWIKVICWPLFSFVRNESNVWC